MLKQRLRRSAVLLALCAALSCALTLPASAAGFRDVPDDHWAASEIRRCAELGLFQGQSADRFGLGQPMTRSAFAVVLCRFFGWEQTVTDDHPFTDVPADAWYAGAVDAAYANGALTRQDRQFRPDDPITREELTVTLLRALGYTTLSGLAEDLSHPFTDVTSNAGYVTLAYDMGLMNGTSAAVFSPGLYATREQVAVIFMRLHDKFYGGTPLRLAILTNPEGLPALTGLDAAAIPAFRLVGSGGAFLSEGSVSAADADALKAAAEDAGAQTLLHVTGSSTALSGDTAKTAALLADAVEAGGYDGLFLDIPGRKTDGGLLALTQKLDTLLGEKLFYLTAEAPAWHGTAYNGYRYADLAACVDRLFLRVAPYTDSKTPVAPMSPPEEIYFALRSLRGTAADGKLGLLLDAEANRWQNGAIQNTLTAEELSAHLEKADGVSHYSERYACAYLMKSNSLGIWYPDSRGVAARVRLLRLFGADALCLTDLNAAPADVLAAAVDP